MAPKHQQRTIRSGRACAARAPAVPALAARQPKAACRAGARINLPKISHA